MHIKATRARTAHRNTPETDLLPEVEHLVDYIASDGSTGTINVMARDPGDAIRIVNHLDAKVVEAKLKELEKQRVEKLMSPDVPWNY